MVCELVCDKCNHMWAFHGNDGSRCEMPMGRGNLATLCGCKPAFPIPSKVAYERFVFSILEEQKRVFSGDA